MWYVCPLQLYLPSNHLREELVVLTHRVIETYIPALAWFATHVPNRIGHKFASISSTSSIIAQSTDQEPGIIQSSFLWISKGCLKH